jgi:Uma2 family endonuclease
VRVRIQATDRTTYPDLSVVCGKLSTAAPEDPHAITNPIVLVEVLSKDTEADDRGEKFAHYRRLPSLREYVLINQGKPRIEVFRREGDHWSLYEWGAGEVVQLASLDCRISVDGVYRDPLASA